MVLILLFFSIIILCVIFGFLFLISLFSSVFSVPSVVLILPFKFFLHLCLSVFSVFSMVNFLILIAYFKKSSVLSVVFILILPFF